VDANGTDQVSELRPRKLTKNDLNEAARAADASREANVAVYGEWLK
jgi:hypothetical protein